ncbi:MAG: hypothetical protein ABI663_12275 [Chryseolinea sp.]
MKRTIQQILLVLSLSVLSAFGFVETKPRVFLIGDSTTANKKQEAFPETGWGMIFSKYINLEVQNHAVNGRSTRSFRTLGHWEKVEELL